LSIWESIAHAIAAHTGTDFQPESPRTVSGGCINTAYVLGDGRQTWFVKTNRADRLDMFEAEADGLDALAATQTMATPRALCSGTCDGIAYLVVEYLAMGRNGPDGWHQAGQRLAAMHRHTEQRFGWHRSNTIGATPQHNDWTGNWTQFWRDRRLGFQLEEAARNGHSGRLQRLGDQLRSRLDVLIDHQPAASLLHGDLWSGNLAFTRAGEPVIYDPATYFGDREADLAMTELFGGFDAEFYAAYFDAWPVDDGYRVRKTLYNLYHILNHLNLFGGGYGSQAERMIEQLLAEC
jgi:protein-ribulosamine 3-kinase